MVSIPSSLSLSARPSQSLRHVECRDRWLKSLDMAGLQYRVVRDVWYESNAEAPPAEVALAILKSGEGYVVRMVEIVDFPFGFTEKSLTILEICLATDKN